MTGAAILAAGLAAYAALALAVHVLSVLIVARRFRALPPAPPAPEGLTVLRPICGTDPHMAATLASSFPPHAPQMEVIFCTARADDPAISLAQAAMAARPDVPSRLLVGEDMISGNPKLNNLVKGWQAARYRWIAMIDSNVALPPDYVERLFATWTPGTGLVTSPPAGTAPEGFWARVEAGFLNTYQDRWQLLADAVGHGFAQGKVLFWRRDILDAAGGPAAIGRDLAEDVASTKVVRAAKLRVRVVPQPFAQPLGPRTRAAVWDRQVRWARVRRAGFPLIFALEPLSGAVLPVASMAVLSGGWVAPAIFAAVWFGAEWVLARRAGWPAGLADVAAWMLRDAMIPLLWLAAFRARGFVWRGNAMTPDDSTLQA